MDEYEALRRRYVRGEIDADEYGRRLEALPGRTVREGLEASARTDDFVVAPRTAQPPTTAPRRRVSPFVPIVGGCLMVFGVLAALGATVSGFVASVAVNDQTYRGESTSKTFQVGDAPKIVIRNADGRVIVRTGQPTQVEVTTTAVVHGLGRGGGEADPRQAGAKVRQEGGMVVVEAGPTFSPASWFDAYRGTDITITAPPAADLDVELKGGTLDVGGVTGVLKARVESGLVEVREAGLAAGSRVTMESGDVEIDGELTGAEPALDVEVESGRVKLQLPRDTDAELSAYTDSGDIEIDGWEIEVLRGPDDGPGSGSEETASGSLSGPEPSGKISVQVHSGDIRLDARR